jgi:light-regulated signal transduction histidine kinase (bacteriophytochrome)
VQSEKLEEMVAQRTLELNRSNEDLQQFAHVASHDLKEPLRKIGLFSNRLESEFGEILPAKGKTYLEKINSASVRMTNLIENVLNYASVNGVKPDWEPLDLNQIMQQVKDDLEALILQKNAIIRYGDLPALTGAPALLSQLFFNLVNNALKFSKPGVSPVIEIGAQMRMAPAIRENLPPGIDPPHVSRPTYQHITVTDNGMGFSPLYAEKIFNAFTRLNGRDQIEGTGLGLALCKKIVHRHEGILYAESTEGEGATFHVLLPA